MLGRGPRRPRIVSKFAAGALAALGAVAVGNVAHAAEATMLLLDASNSMNSNFDGSHRFDAAKQAISENVPRYDTQLDIGLVTFGSRQRQSCTDVQTLVPPGPGNASRLVIAANSIKAQGVSLFGQAMLRAAEEAKYKNTPTSIIALVDGASVKACGVDACQAAAQLKRDARDLTVHVIALAPKAAEVPALECVASTTGGTYVTVADARQVRNALDLALRASLGKAQSPDTSATAPAPKRKPKPPVLLANAPPPPSKPDPAMARTDASTAGERGTAPAEPGAPSGDADSTVSVFAPTRPAGSVAAQTQVAETAQPAAPRTEQDSGNQVVMAPTARSEAVALPAKPAPPKSAKVATLPGTTVLYKRPAPADKPSADSGKPVVRTPQVDTAKASNPQPAQAPAGSAGGLAILPASEAATPAVNAPAVASQPPAAETSPGAAGGNGAVRLSAMIVAGAKPIPEGMMWQIYRQAADGTRGPLATRSSDPTPVLKLPAGRYVVEGRFGNALRDMAMVIEPGKQTEADLVLNVGGLQLVPAVAGVTNPDADITNTIFSTDDLANPVVANAAAGAVIYLSAGRYRIVSRYGNANSIAEDDIQIQRGKLTQAKINHRAAPISFRLVGEAGGTPLTGASWVITDAAGTVVKRTDEATPAYVLVEGDYQISATRDGQTFTGSIAVRQGVPATIEIMAK